MHTHSALVLRFSASEFVTPLQVLNLLEQSFTAETGDTVLFKVGMVARVLDTLAVSGAAHPRSVTFVSVDVVPDMRYLALHRAKFHSGVAFRLCHTCTPL